MTSTDFSRQGRVKATKFKIEHKKGTAKRFLLTSAQSNTGPFKPAWDNMLALADYVDAKVIVAPYTYDKVLWSASGQVLGEVTSKDLDRRKQYQWDSAFKEHMRDEYLMLGKSLVFCAGTNILPTAVRPLVGFETHTGRRSAIYPHSKIEMMSVASGKLEGTKLLYTTGTATKRNYLQKKAGQKAERMHCYGGLMVEVTEDGSFYVRQVQADEKGVMHDLDLRVEDGRVSSGNPVEAIVWGDIHARHMDPRVLTMAWDKGGMLDELQPKHQFFHDVFDMRFRNHHERMSPYKMFEVMTEGFDYGEQEAQLTAQFLKDSLRAWCKSVVVKSNHDDAFERWLDSPDCFRDRDARNLLLWLEANTARFRAASEGDKRFLVIEWLLRQYGAPRPVQFLGEDESFIVCKDAEGGIELGLHGHRGINGSKGQLSAFAKMGRKTITADGHSAGIMDGAYRVGVASKLDHGYNKGPSSWSQTSGVVYPNGMRTLITFWNGRWRG